MAEFDGHFCPCQHLFSVCIRLLLSSFANKDLGPQKKVSDVLFQTEASAGG